MNCWRIGLWKKMTAYIHGELPAELVSKLEDHLSECETCRSRLENLRATHQSTTQVPLAEAPDASWDAIERQISQSPGLPHAEHHPRYLLRGLAGAAALVAFCLFFLIWNEGPTSLLDRGPDQFFSGQYRPVALRDIPNSAEPHVATEGYVSEVIVDAVEGDTRFRLVDNLNRPNHFIVCEIIPPMDMKVPEIGSRIRVYGVSRYDGKAEHQWFELHPVMSIEPAR